MTQTKSWQLYRPAVKAGRSVTDIRLKLCTVVEVTSSKESHIRGFPSPKKFDNYDVIIASTGTNSKHNYRFNVI